MQTRWFSNLPKAKQEEFKKSVLASANILDKAAEIVYNMIIVESKPSQQDYDSPSWAFKQAHSNGRLEALREIHALLKVSDQEQ